MTKTTRTCDNCGKELDELEHRFQFEYVLTGICGPLYSDGPGRCAEHLDFCHNCGAQFRAGFNNFLAENRP